MITELPMGRFVAMWHDVTAGGIHALTLKRENSKVYAFDWVNYEWLEGKSAADCMSELNLMDAYILTSVKQLNGLGD